MGAATEAGIDENRCLLNSKPTCNTFSKVKYLSSIRDDPGGKYLRVYCNIVVTYINKIY